MKTQDATRPVITSRTCHLCEATCGLELTLHGRKIMHVRGDAQDVFSRGFICPKGAALGRLEDDPDRVRQPLVRRGSDWHQVSWAEAFAEVERGLAPILAEHGRDAVAVYLGNPNAHNLASMIYGRVLLQALGSVNVYSASTVDQMPKQVSAGLMFGGGLSIPVPDIDRTHHLLVLGADPMTSNGSLMTAPDVPGRLRALRERGGKLVVVDPRRSATAAVADEHLFIVPGTDAHLLFAMVATLFDEGLAEPGPHLEPHLRGIDEIRSLARDFAPEIVAPVCGIEAGTIRRLARELAEAPTAAVYGRIGTCTQEFGTLASWLVDVVNVLTGNLDCPGGAMFANPATGIAASGGEGKSRGVRFGRRQSRVRGQPERFGELPVVCLAEEIETPGKGQIRALVTLAGNPVLSNPESARLDRAIASLDFVVSLDIYRNETTRRANVLLPAEPELARGHYDLALYSLAIRNVARYSPPIVELEPNEYPEWRTLLRLAAIVAGQGASANEDALDDFVVAALVQKTTSRRGSNVEGRDTAELLRLLSSRRGPERVLDLMLRTGPHGDGFGAVPGGLSLDVLLEHPHGIDLGALEPRIPGVLRTPSGAIELAPEPIVADVVRLRDSMAERRKGFVLIGRRELRSNNSWMHNLPLLVSGKARCTAQVNSTDASRLGIGPGASVRVRSRTGEVVLSAEVTDAVMPGVVSIPHGWGHDLPGAELRVAAERPGVNSNLLADNGQFDPLSGNAVLNGIPVELSPAGDPP